MFQVSTFARDKRGTIAVIYSLAMVPLLAAAGAALDYSRLVASRTQLQVLADRAALQGVLALGDTSGTSAVKEAAGIKTATDVVTGAAPAASKTVTASGANQTVTVALTADEKLMLGGFLGRSHSTVAVQATSQYKDVPVPVCLLALEPSATGITFQGNGSFLGDGCIVWSNSASTTASMLFKGGSTIKAKAVCANGKISRTGSNTITPTPKENCGAFPNPFASWTPPVVPSTNCDYHGTMAEITIGPGVYCSGSKIDSPGNLTLNSGIYVVKDVALTINSNAKITGTDVQFILLGNSSISIVAGSDLNLTAPLDASGKRVLIARGDQSTPSGASGVTGNASLVMNGSIYLPKSTLEVTGNGTLSVGLPEQSIVAKSIIVSGTGKIEFKGRDKGTAPNATVPGQLSTRLTQ